MIIKPRTQTRFDWLTVRFTDISNIARLMDSIGLRNLTWIPLGHSYDHYPHAEVIHISGKNSNIITLAWKFNNNDEITTEDNDGKFRTHSFKRYEVCINFTGTGLDYFRKVLKREYANLTWAIHQMFEMRGNFTRVDLAHDFFNFDKHYSAKYLAQQAYRGNFVSSARYCKWVNSFNSHGGNSKNYNGTKEGDTLYIGKNPKQLRVYNKLAEEHPMAVNSQGISIFAHSAYKSWQRWEIQVNHNYANDLIRQWVKEKYDALQTWTDFISSNYRFITKKGQTKPRAKDYPTATWFKKIIATGNKFEQSPEVKPDNTFRHARKWLHRQVFGVLGNMIQARVQQVYQHCNSYSKAEKIISRLFIYKLLQYLTDNHKNNVSQIDAYLTEARCDPINITNAEKVFNTKGVLD